MSFLLAAGTQQIKSNELEEVKPGEKDKFEENDTEP